MTREGHLQIHYLTIFSARKTMPSEGCIYTVLRAFFVVEKQCIRDLPGACRKMPKPELSGFVREIYCNPHYSYVLEKHETPNKVALLL